MNKMHKPPHPGELIRSTLLEANCLSITDAAKMLSVTRGSLSKLINCRGGLSPEMAVRLSIALNTSAEMWLNLQKNYDLWSVEKTRSKLQREVTRITPSAAHFKIPGKVLSKTK